MKITSLKAQACVLSLGLAVASAYAVEDQSDQKKNQSQQKQQQYDKKDQSQTDATFGAKSSVAAPLPANKVSSLIGMSVNDQNGEKIGDIKDLVLDLDSGRVAYAVFGTTGKERLFAIPVSAFQASTDANQKSIVLHIDRQKFESAQGFDKNTWPGLKGNFGADPFWTTSGARSSATSDISIGATASSKDQSVAVESSNAARDRSAAEQSATARNQAADRTQSPSATGREGSNRSGNLNDQNKATKLLGLKVKNQQGENLGEIKDMVIDLQSGRISYVVLGYGGTLGVGEKLLAIPLTALTLGTDTKSVVLNATKQKLESAQGFDKNNWPSVSNPTWGADRFWEEQGGVRGNPESSPGRQGLREPQGNQPGSPRSPDQK